MKTGGIILAAGLALTACSPDKFDGADENGLPNISGVDYTVTVDQNTNVATFTLNTPECYPIWTIEGSPEYKGTVNGYQKRYIFKGTYKYTLKVGNRNGVSDGEITEILGVVAMFAFLNRWNDTMATPLEAPAAAIAQRALGDQGWTAGKHAP